MYVGQNLLRQIKITIMKITMSKLLLWTKVITLFRKRAMIPLSPLTHPLSEDKKLPDISACEDWLVYVNG